MQKLSEPEAFGEFFAEHRARLESVARRVTRDADMAQDVVADAAVRVWQRLQASEVDNPAGYFTTAVRNEALDQLRRLKRERGAVLELAELPAQRGDESRVDDRDEVQRLLRVLTPAQRSTLRLRYAYGCSEAEIARSLGVPAGTVKSYAHRALRRLRDAAVPA